MAGALDFLMLMHSDVIEELYKKYLQDCCRHRKVKEEKKKKVIGLSVCCLEICPELI